MSLIVAMDFHGSLQSQPALRKHAANLLNAGVGVVIISALGQDDPNEQAYRNEIASWGIPFTALEFIRFSGVPVPDVARKVGKAKIEVMRRYGCQVLFDDNPHICRAVRDAGLLAAFVGEIK